MNTRSIGKLGEDTAVTYLQKNGYKVLDRNFNCHYGEIDIIARHGIYYVFIEVKSRNTVAFGTPREAVTSYKQQRIISAAQNWLVKKRIPCVPVRFDVVEVVDGVASVIKDAFRP